MKINYSLLTQTAELVTPILSCHSSQLHIDYVGFGTCSQLLSNGKAGIPETPIPDAKSHLQTTHPVPGTMYILRGSTHFL